MPYPVCAVPGVSHLANLILNRLQREPVKRHELLLILATQDQSAQRPELAQYDVGEDVRVLTTHIERSIVGQGHLSGIAAIHLPKDSLSNEGNVNHGPETGFIGVLYREF